MNNQKMKKIAFLSFDWNNEVVSQYITGVERFLKDHDDVVLHLYDGFGNFGTYEVHRGALEIFNLPDMQNYDGLVIEGNRAWKPEKRQMIADRAIAAGLPVVSVNYPLKGCMNVSSDNEESEYQIVSHVIREHGVRNLAFVRGLSTSLETAERENGFLRAVQENDIDHYRILDGSWESEAGAEAVRTLLNDGRMPEAIICSNDDAAYGAIEELKKRKYRIPENIIVTGFDNLNIAEASEPRITTVSRNYAGMAYAALDLLLLHTETQQNSTVEMKISGRLMKGSSCGCGDCRQEIQDIKQKYVSANLRIKNFYRAHDDVEGALDHAENLPEIADALEERVPSLLNGSFWMVINGPYLDHYESNHLISHYGDHMYLYAIADGEKHEHDEKHVYETFPGNQILPEAYLNREQCLEIYPLHYDETAVGYVVMNVLVRKEEMNFLEVMFSLLESAMEHVHGKAIQNALNQKLTSLYMTDQQTGLFNRFGMEKIAGSYYEEHHNRKRFVTFIDIDNMKNINDRYGHEAGDTAIQITADTLKSVTADRDDIAIRYGGDEFVIFSDRNVKEMITEALPDSIRKQKISWGYTLSIGVIQVNPGDSLSMQEAVNQADAAMYAVKNSKKAK